MSNQEYESEKAMFHLLRDDDYSEEDLQKALPSNLIYRGDEDDDNPQIPGFHDVVGGMGEDWA